MKLVMNKMNLVVFFVGCFCLSASGADSLIPYQSKEDVPANVIDLWKDYDARKDPLETTVIKEWREDGIVHQYLTFKVGRFKGADSRISAYYTFPEGAKSIAGIVWAHGGGQRQQKYLNPETSNEI